MLRQTSREAEREMGELATKDHKENKGFQKSGQIYYQLFPK